MRYRPALPHTYRDVHWNCCSNYFVKYTRPSLQTLTRPLFAFILWKEICPIWKASNIYQNIRGRVDDFSFFECSSPFCFFWIEFLIILFPIFIKYYHIMFIIIVFWIGCNRPSGLLWLGPLSKLTILFLPSSSVSLSDFILAVPMRECLGKHSCMSSSFPSALLNGTCFFPTACNYKCTMCIRSEKLEIVKH